jgi:hypothetical protein
METLLCLFCNTDRPADQFKLGNTGQPATKCNSCVAAYQAAYRRENRAKLNADAAAYRAKNTEVVKEKDRTRKQAGPPVEGEPAYLNESSLGRFLRERLDPEVICGSRVPAIARLFRPDYRSEKHKLIVEFDGFLHYTGAKHVIEDELRDQILTATGYYVVRVPYFVQLTEPVIEQLFGWRVTDRRRFKDFPHGFIADNVVFPADFCELGVARFLDDLERFPAQRSDILGSMERATVIKGDWRLVYPTSMSWNSQ